MSDMAPFLSSGSVEAINPAAAGLSQAAKAHIDAADQDGPYQLLAADWRWVDLHGPGSWTPEMQAYRQTLRDARDERGRHAWPIDRAAGQFRHQYAWIAARGD